MVQKANYDKLTTKDANTLYFITDTRQIFKGTDEYTKSCKLVSALPASGQIQGLLYIRMTDYTFHIWNGTEFVQLNRPIVTEIPNADASDDNLPTTKAVADYVNAKIAATEGKGRSVRYGCHLLPCYRHSECGKERCSCSHCDERPGP